MPVGLDSEHIEWNVHALRRGIIGWGGFEAIALASYRGDEDKHAIGGSVDQSGVGYAEASATVLRAESSKASPSSETRLNAYDIRNGTLGIAWNMNALNSRIRTHQEIDPAIRAKQLDGAVRRAAISGIWSHNVIDVIEDRETFNNIINIGIDGLLLADLVRTIVAHDYTHAVERLAGRAIVTGAWRGVSSITQRVSFLKDKLDDPFFSV